MSLALELLYIPVWIMRMAAGWAVLIFDHKYAKSWSFCTDLERGTITAWHFWIGCQIIQSVGIWSQLYEIFRFQGLYQFTGTKRFPQCFSYNQATIHIVSRCNCIQLFSISRLINCFCLIWLSSISVFASFLNKWDHIIFHFNMPVNGSCYCPECRSTLDLWHQQVVKSAINGQTFGPV